MKLRTALRAPDSLGAVVSATIAGVNADGTVTIDLGGGSVIPACAVLAPYAPGTGDVVQAIRRDASSWLVLGVVRTSNATTVGVGADFSFPFNVTPAASTIPPGPTSGKSTFTAASASSWRNDGNGWSKSQPYQGAYTTAHGYYRGCYFYGTNAFSSLRGRTCTAATITMARPSTGGNAGPVAMLLAPHAHATQPGGSPVFVGSTQNVGGVSWGATVTLSMPASWGQLLIDGRAAGIGHNYLGTASYSINQGPAQVATAGQIILTWT